MKKTSKLLPVILSFLLILAVCLGSTLLLQFMRHSLHNRTEEVQRDQLDIDVGIFAKQDISEDLLPGLLDSEGQNGNGTPLEIKELDADFVHDLNRFISYFSEQSFSAYPPPQGNQQALIDFSYQYYKIHESSALQSAVFSDTLSARNVDAVLDRFFGMEITHEDTQYIYHSANDYHCRRFSIATSIFLNEDGSYGLIFDTYKILDKDPEASVPIEYYDLHDLDTRANTGLMYLATGKATVEQTADGFHMLNYNSGTSQQAVLRPYDSAEQYRINAFLSTFSEQLFEQYDPENHTSLIQFAYRYLSLNQPDSVVRNEDVYEGFITKTQVDTTLTRFFGTTVTHSQEQYSFPLDSNMYRHYYSIVTAIKSNGDGTLRVEFDVYAVAGAYLIPEKCYWFTREEAERDWSSIYCGSGTADLRDYLNGEIKSYQVIAYATGEITPPYTRNRSDTMVPMTYLLEYMAQCNPSKTPSAMEMLKLQDMVTACCRTPLDFLFEIPTRDLQIGQNYFQTQEQRVRYTWRAVVSDPYFGQYRTNASPESQSIPGAIAIDFQQFSDYYESLFGEKLSPESINGMYCNSGCNFIIENRKLYGNILSDNGYTLCLKKPVFTYDSSQQLYVITMDLLTAYECTQQNGTHYNNVTFPYFQYSGIDLMVYPQETVFATVKLYLKQVDGQYRYHSCILDS